MGLFDRWWPRAVRAVEPKPVDRSFSRQMQLEDEGRAAGFACRTRESVPYPEGTFEWNHWIFGYDGAVTPRYIFPDGRLVMVSTVATAIDLASPDWLLKYPDGRVTDQQGNPTTIARSE